HRLDATGQDQVLPAGADPLGGLVDGFEAARAEPVELDAAGRVGQAGRDGGDLGDVGSLVADRCHAPEHEVVDGGRVEVGEPASQLVDQPDDEVDRLHLVQSTVLLAASTRGADGVVHECIGDRAGH